MSRKYFGTDGVRGRVGEAAMTPGFVMRLGYAAGEVLIQRHRQLRPDDHPAVLIGKDTRVSGYMLEAALQAGLSAAGVDVVLSGPLPTPGIAYLTRALRLSAGIVISASHNPYYDNGIKFFSADGLKLPDDVEAQIEAGLGQEMECRESRKLGKARRIEDAAGRYIEFCKSTFPPRLDLRGMKVVVDCAHGAAYHIAPHVFHELGADVVAVGVKPDGFNINDGVGATRPASIQAAVREHRADVGIALDGDADRIIMTDAEGTVFDGDQLLYVIARDRARTGELAGVAGTLMTNLALELEMARLGVAFGRAKVGDRYVLEMMMERGWELGGENSGHVICLDKHSTGDGIVSALQVLAAMCGTNRSLTDLAGELVLFPQVLINVTVPRGFDWEKSESVVRAKQAAEASLGRDGRVLLRPSGTEPVLRVMVEGRDGDKVNALAKELAAMVQSAA